MRRALAGLGVAAIVVMSAIAGSAAAQAFTNTQIASRLGIAQSTVKRHLTNAYSRLGADSRIDAINKAVAFGLIQLPQNNET